MTRIVRVAVDGRAEWGAITGDEIVRFSKGPFGTEPTLGDPLGPLAEAQLLAPVRPSKVVCVARNYVAHAAEHAAEVPEAPLLFFKPPSAVIGPGAAVELPAESDRVEHEGELALIVGRRCRRIPEDQAWSAVLGVACANDVTARDIQRSEKLWTRGKGFDTFCPVGPWIVAGLDRDDVADLAIRCSVNGEPPRWSSTRRF
jgi:2-keto-4-pentenoate hydratase/2-oxohepta-3-ene-1,7-dioic acid hydratase in catechol pathway